MSAFNCSSWRGIICLYNTEIRQTRHSLLWCCCEFNYSARWCSEGYDLMMTCSVPSHPNCLGEQSNWSLEAWSRCVSPQEEAQMSPIAWEKPPQNQQLGWTQGPSRAGKALRQVGWDFCVHLHPVDYQSPSPRRWKHLLRCLKAERLPGPLLLAVMNHLNPFKLVNTRGAKKRGFRGGRVKSQAPVGCIWCSLGGQIECVKYRASGAEKQNIDPGLWYRFTLHWGKSMLRFCHLQGAVLAILRFLCNFPVRQCASAESRLYKSNHKLLTASPLCLVEGWKGMYQKTGSYSQLLA